MSLARAFTLTLLVFTALAVVAGCGGGGGSAGGGVGINPGTSGSLTLRVVFSDAAPRLEVEQDQGLLVAAQATERIVINFLDASGQPVMGSTVVDRDPTQATVVTIHGIPFGRWTLQIDSYNASGVRIGEFCQDVTIEPGVSNTVRATVTPVVSPSPSPSPLVGGTFVYVAGNGNDMVSGDVLGPTRNLTGLPGSPWSAGYGAPRDLAVSPGKDVLFVAQEGTSGTGGYVAFRIAMDGALSWMASVACPVAGARPYRVLPHPTENRFFGAQNNGGGIIEGPYDPVLGTLSLGPPAPGLSLATLASKPDGQYLYSSDGPTIGIWSTAPGLSSSGSYTMPDVVTELEMHPSGAYLFAATGGTSNRVFSLAIDSAGNLSGIGTPVVLGPSARCGGMALSQDGNFLVLAVDDGSATGWVQVVGVSPTGTLSPVGSWEAWTSDSARKPQDVAVAPDGTLLVASAGVTTTEPGSLRPFTLDGAGVLTPTGQIQLTGSNPVRVIVVVK